MDLDRDGRTDIITGSWPGELYLFRRLPDGTFAAGARIEDRDGTVINVGQASVVFAADWDADGDLDLLVGTIEGYLYLIPNEGTAKDNAFGSPRKLDVDARPIKVAHGDAGPVAADWDADSKLDLIVGAGDGSVLWYRNVGSSTEPKLAAAETLVPTCERMKRVVGPSEDDEQDVSRIQPNQRGYRAKVCVTDWNGDGRLDLLLGDAGETFVALPEQSDAEKAAVEKARKDLPELLKHWSDALADYRAVQKSVEGEDAGARQEREERATTALEKVNDLKKEIAAAQATISSAQPQRQLHGRVWLFVRQPGRLP